MLNFLPLIFEDELLLSIFARYKNMCGMISQQALEKDLFNRVEGKNSIWLPQGLNAVISNFPPNSKISVNELILKHTMYPYYTAFLSQEKSQKIFEAMTTGGNKPINTFAGLGGTKVKPSNNLRYCPLCFQNDLELYGESCWRRLPQIPGALYCPIHKVLYKESSAFIKSGKSVYICADEDTCNVEIAEDTYSMHFKEHNLIYVENVRYLLNQHSSRAKLPFIIRFYIDKLRDYGLASVNGNLYIDKLISAFLNYYSLDYLRLMQSELDVEQETNWLRLFVRNNNKNRSPLRHLLFLQFLSCNVSNLFEEERATGKRSVAFRRNPKFSITERREAWIKLIEANPGANRAQLKQLGKGLHTWICAHDWDWYDKVTPKASNRKKRKEVVDWEQLDNEYVKLAQQAVQKILQAEGKPKRVTKMSIRNAMEIKNKLQHKKLIKTKAFLDAAVEDINSYRKRKIRWAINEMTRNGQPLTVYKVERYVGFDSGNKMIKAIIEEVLDEYQ